MSAGTGSASTAGDYNTTKDSYIPLFSGAPSDYKEWRKRINIYVMKMRVAKREPEGLLSIIGSLTGTAWKLLKNFPIDEIEKAGAFEKMLKILDKAFEYDRTVQLPSQLQRRPGLQTLLEYTTEHDHLYSKLADHDVTLPSKVQGWHLLRRAGLSKEQKQLVTTQAPNMAEDITMPNTVVFAVRDVAMRSTMRTTTSMKLMIGLMTTTMTMTMREGTTKMRTTPKIHRPQLLTATMMRPLRTSTLMPRTTRPWKMQIPLSRLKSMTQPMHRTSMPADASTRSSSAEDICQLWH